MAGKRKNVDVRIAKNEKAKLLDRVNCDLNFDGVQVTVNSDEELDYEDDLLGN